jgi:uncharacterized membrane protein
MGLKQFATVSFLLSLLLLVTETVADISYYGASVNLQANGRSLVELVISFEQPVKNFSFEILGRIENFAASSIAGPMDCRLEIRGISVVDCTMNLTTERKTIQINYETADFIKPLGNRFLFTGDLSLQQNISNLVVVVKLPEGTALVAEEGAEPGRLTFAKNASTSSDGRRIIVKWQMTNVSAEVPLKFEIFYESLTTPFWAQLRIRYFLAFGAAAGAVAGLIILRRLKKSEQLVLSVLDEFERAVVDAIAANQGEASQRLVVEKTNLSKAKVSRVVKKLAERGIIEVQRLGRTNKLKLIKKKFTP